MSVKRDELVPYLHELLVVDSFKDYCPNGLQIQGKETIKHVVLGVTACQALLLEAVRQNADAVLVHHGVFWKNDPMGLTGHTFQRVKTVIQHGMNLLAYHLPLDAHPQYGNNVELANILGLSRVQVSELDPIVFTAEYEVPLAGEELAGYLAKALNREPLYVAGNDKPVQRIALCTGAAQSRIEVAATLGCDAYITGEASEASFHLANELGLHFYAAGHHATERYGVMALGQHLLEKFGVSCQFVDIDNPV